MTKTKPHKAEQSVAVASVVSSRRIDHGYLPPYRLQNANGRGSARATWRDSQRLTRSFTFRTFYSQCDWASDRRVDCNSRPGHQNQNTMAANTAFISDLDSPQPELTSA